MADYPSGINPYRSMKRALLGRYNEKPCMCERKGLRHFIAKKWNGNGI